MRRESLEKNLKDEKIERFVKSKFDIKKFIRVCQTIKLFFLCDWIKMFE